MSNNGQENIGELKPPLLPTMLVLLFLGGSKKTIRVTTTEIAQKIGRSQQTVSNHLLILEQEGYIERVRFRQKYGVKFTQKGVDAVRQIYLRMKRVLEGMPESMVIQGHLFTGIGEGAYYVSLRGYMTQFIQTLGFAPFPGTLNIKLTSLEDRRLRRELEQYRGIQIQEFDDGQRTYGSARCFHAQIKDVEGAILAIERTHYDDSVLEFIAPINIREKLGLKDGDEVIVNISLKSDNSSKN